MNIFSETKYWDKYIWLLLQPIYLRYIYVCVYNILVVNKLFYFNGYINILYYSYNKYHPFYYYFLEKVYWMNDTYYLKHGPKIAIFVIKLNTLFDFNWNVLL